jgi:cytochrome oxidase Cu insertion factor (SCO1/SenC/PrrC family)
VPAADVLSADGSAFRHHPGRLKADRRFEVHLATVSFDPVTDTPPVLKKHASSSAPT